MYEITLLLESKDVPASNGATFDRLNPSRDVASRAAAAQIADASGRRHRPQPPSRPGPPPARMPGARSC